ncbi:hypothetical protein [Hymenobacter koreensis]|uniref:Dihydroorotate dehydrogenase n=1 Tax=Hymenobacter koreensis TaxID=1084523 RepID=A0ABP8JLX3_9BACT
MQLGPSLILQNPVCLAAAPWHLPDGFGYERLGAIFTKTVIMEPRPGGRGDGVIRVADASLLNTTDRRTDGAEQLVQEQLPRLRRYAVPVLVSITAPGIPGFRKIARYLAREAAGQIAGVEVYISTATTQNGFDITPRFVRDVTEAVRTELGDQAAVLVKLPPWPDHVRALALGAQDGGASALAAANTLKALHIPENGEPLLGGLSGEALRPIALRCVYELAHDEKITLPIIGTGGIFTANHVSEYLRCGAAAVQVATGEWLEPGLTPRLAAEWEEATSLTSNPTEAWNS